MLPEQARPARVEIPKPAAIISGESPSIVSDPCQVHLCFESRRRLKTSGTEKRRSSASRLFAAVVAGRWRHTGRCFETQECLAKEFGTTSRAIRRWEAEGAAAGQWKIEMRGRHRHLVLTDTGQPCPQSPPAIPDTRSTTPDTGVQDTGHPCPPINKSSINNSRLGGAAAGIGARAPTAPIADALAAIAVLGISEPSLSRVQDRLQATWLVLERRGGGHESLFRQWWQKLVAEAQGPSVKSAPAWLTAALLKNDRADGLLAGMLRPGAGASTKCLPAAYREFVPPDPEA